MSFRIKNPMAIGIALLLFAQPAAVSGARLAPCREMTGTIESDLCGEWAVGAHALYFTPITCPYAYANALEVTNSPNLTSTRGQAEVVPCHADWGFRLFGNYLKGCFFAGVSYQWLEVTTTSTTTGDRLRLQGSANVGAGSATGQVNIGYQNVDVRLGQYLLRGCGSALYWYGNARWVDLSHKRSASTLFTTAGTIPEDFQEKSQLEGGALGIGFGGELDVWCNFGAFVDGNLLGVIGKRSLKNVRVRGFQIILPPDTTPFERRESYPSETCVIPEVDFRIGVNYTYACGCWKLVGEIGYEVDYFWQGSVFPDLPSISLVNGFTEYAPVCENLGFSGLFFGGRLIF